MLNQTPMTDPNQDIRLKKHRRLITLVSAGAVLLLLALLARLIGPPLMSAVRNKESFRLWIDAQGPWKYLIMIGIMTAQIIIALIPGAPVEMAAGYAFGLWGGIALCLIGTVLGNAIIITLTRIFGMKMVRLFVDEAKIRELTGRLTREQRRLDLMVFILFLIPGTPKDLMTYVAGLLPIPLPRYLILTSIARIPSMIGNALGGSMLGMRNYKAALLTMGIVVLISAAAFLIYRYTESRQRGCPLPGPEDSPDTENEGKPDV